MASGRLAGAAQLAREQLAVWRGLGVSGYLAGSLERFGVIVAAAGHGASSSTAGGGHGTARDGRRAAKRQWQAEIEEAIAPARATLGEAVWSEAFVAGQVSGGRRPSPRCWKNRVRITASVPKSAPVSRHNER